jgi:beta-lactamase class A
MIDRYRNYQPYSAQKPRKKSHRGFLLVLIVGLLVGGGFLRHTLQPKKTQTTTKATVKPKKTVKAEPISSDIWNQLNQQVTAIINQHTDLDVSVAVVDINSNTKANYGVQESFAAASTTKILTAVDLLQKVEQGKESLSENINGMTAKQQLKQMIDQSNNESWAALNDELGGSAIEPYAHSIGLSSYKWTDNLLTAGDDATLLQKIYDGDLLNDTSKQLLFSYMQNTNNEAMIPKVAPAGSIVYHKYGQLDSRLHDSAIIVYQNRPIVLVIYTKGQVSADGTEYTNRVKVIQQLATTVIDNIYQK